MELTVTVTRKTNKLIRVDRTPSLASPTGINEKEIFEDVEEIVFSRVMLTREESPNGAGYVIARSAPQEYSEPEQVRFVSNLSDFLSGSMHTDQVLEMCRGISEKYQSQTLEAIGQANGELLSAFRSLRTKISGLLSPLKKRKKR